MNIKRMVWPVLAALMLAMGGTRTTMAQQPAPVCTPERRPEMTPQAAYDSLLVGNIRFVRDVMLRRSMRCGRDSTVDGQHPFATVLTCMDSRTPPEYIFDRGLGELFTLRVAGNVLNGDILGSMEYAAAKMNTKVIVVLGHTDCGAVKAACDNAYVLDNLNDLLGKLAPAIAAVDSTIKPRNSSNPAFVRAATLANVLYVMDQIPKRSTTLRTLLDAGKIKLVAGLYDGTTGLVKFYWEYKLPQKK